MANNDYLDYISHSGIKGMKWGVRRYRNYDGTLTNAGKDRYSEDGNVRSKMSSETKSNIAKGIGIGLAGAAAAALTVYALKNPDKVKEFVDKAKPIVKEKGSKAVKVLEERGKAVGKSFVDAAIASSATIALTKAYSAVDKKFGDSEGDSEAKRIANKIASDSIKSGLKTALGTNVQSNNSGKNNANHVSGSEITSKIGPPSNKNVDRSSEAYQNLFRKPDGGNRSPEERAMIKSMVNNGYDIEQVQNYLDEFAHSAIIGIRWLELYGFEI